jgi:hypothetical protein
MRPRAEPLTCWVHAKWTNHRSCFSWTAPGTESCLGLASQGYRGVLAPRVALIPMGA